jgi:hypothetical protein
MIKRFFVFCFLSFYVLSYGSNSCASHAIISHSRRKGSSRTVEDAILYDQVLKYCSDKDLEKFKESCEVVHNDSAIDTILDLTAKKLWFEMMVNYLFVGFLVLSALFFLFVVVLGLCRG